MERLRGISLDKISISLCLILTFLALISAVYITINSGMKSPSFLVIDLDSDGVEIIPLEKSNVYFDIDGDGLAERTAWVHPDDAFVMIMSNDDRFNSKKRRVSWLLSVLTNLIPKLKKHDLNSDGVFDKRDFLETEDGKKPRSLGIYISKDEASTGIQDFEYKNLEPCVYNELTFGLFKNLSLSCADGKTYKLEQVSFDYEDSNVIWESLCAKWSNRIYGGRDPQDGLICE